jgi:hypothetical protein
MGAYLLCHFIVKELGKDTSFHCVPFLETTQKIKL